MSDESIFECQVRGLERELAAARETLHDRFAMAALTGLVTHYGVATDPWEAFRIADAMMETRKS